MEVRGDHLLVHGRHVTQTGWSGAANDDNANSSTTILVLMQLSGLPSSSTWIRTVETMMLLLLFKSFCNSCSIHKGPTSTFREDAPPNAGSQLGLEQGSFYLPRCFARSERRVEWRKPHGYLINWNFFWHSTTVRHSGQASQKSADGSLYRPYEVA